MSSEVYRPGRNENMRSYIGLLQNTEADEMIGKSNRSSDLPTDSEADEPALSGGAAAAWELKEPAACGAVGGAECGGRGG